MIRVLFIGMRYDYGDPRRGDCYEYVNFFDTLQQMPGVEVTHFPFDLFLRENGRAAMNRRLLATVDAVKPDVCFFVLFTDEILPETLRAISRKGNVLTLNWFTDDHWRFNSFSRHWAPLFDFVTTTDAGAAGKYRALGIRTVIQTQWAYNSFTYRPHDGVCDGSVSFVGQVHSHRRDLVHALERAGIPVLCWGRGWKNGRIGFQEMVRLFSLSAINLNFSESSAILGWRPLAKVALNRRADGSLHLRDVRRMAEHARTLLATHHLQIKGRVFEIPGAGGFLLSEQAEHLEDYFIPGREIVTFATPEEMVEKTRYYLAHEEDRERIRAAGFQRAVQQHSYLRRFQDIFRAMGIHD